MATLHTTSWPILTHSQESSRLPPQDAAAEEVPAPEQLIKLSTTIGYAAQDAAPPPAATHPTAGHTRTTAHAHTGPASAQRPCARTDIHALVLHTGAVGVCCGEAGCAAEAASVSSLASGCAQTSGRHFYGRSSPSTAPSSMSPSAALRSGHGLLFMLTTGMDPRSSPPRAPRKG